MCVNQPEAWWDNPDKHAMCEDNQAALSFFKKIAQTYPCRVIDRSSKGHGWQTGKTGIGWARKVLWDAIVLEADDPDIVVSLDADTFYPPEYATSLVDRFQHHAQATGLSVPYYHPLTEQEPLNRAILRYELYMRVYLLSVMDIGTPFVFTALGSAMAFPVWAYKKIGGVCAKPSGEDFYLLQKLRKIGPVYTGCKTHAWPQARLSDRVGFGTGPALIKGLSGDWSSYPFYSQDTWDAVAKTVALFPDLFTRDIVTPMTVQTYWQSMRKHYATQAHFVRACHEHLDGLRILQYLKSHHDPKIHNNEAVFEDWLTRRQCLYPCPDNWTFDTVDIRWLSAVREWVVCLENQKRQDYDNAL